MKHHEIPGLFILSAAVFQSSKSDRTYTSASSGLVYPFFKAFYAVFIKKKHAGDEAQMDTYYFSFEFVDVGKEPGHGNWNCLFLLFKIIPESGLK